MRVDRTAGVRDPPGPPSGSAVPPDDDAERDAERGSDAVALDTLELVLTSACNLRCSYCYQNAKRPGRMAWETLRAALELLLRSPARQLSVVFLGGEPLLELALIRRAVEHLRPARRAGRRIELSLSTNGLLLDRGAARFLARHQVKTQLSFDAARPMQEVRAPGTFDALDRLLDRLRREQPAFFRRHLSVALTLTAAGLPHLAEAVRYLLTKGVGDVAIAPLITHDAGWRSEHRGLLAEQLARVHRASLAHYYRTGEVPLRLFRRRQPEAKHATGDGELCRAATGQGLAIDVDGQVYACAVFAESYQRFPSTFLGERAAWLNFGDVRAEELPERLASLPDRVRRTEIFPPAAGRRSGYGRCADCRFRDRCAICPASIGHLPGNLDPLRVPDFACAFQQAALACRERFPAQPTPLQVLTGEMRAYGPLGAAQQRLAPGSQPFSASAPSVPGRSRE